MTTFYTIFESPVGELLVTGDPESGALATLSFDRRPGAGWRRASFAEARQQLEAYFAGESHTFDLPFHDAGTAFQRAVWSAVERIPYGTTTTYGALAEEVGAPRDRIRAVGAAVGANPLLVVRPCHRVVGSDGSLTGYAGGLERKRALLTLEGAIQQPLDLGVA
jgi:methylated-DNA-[protein]-cysteine S-methyltransferase